MKYTTELTEVKMRDLKRNDEVGTLGKITHVETYEIRGLSPAQEVTVIYFDTETESRVYTADDSFPRVIREVDEEQEAADALKVAYDRLFAMGDQFNHSVADIKDAISAYYYAARTMERKGHA